nr:D-alanyl-D-alanine carboxypeptidase family protein [Rickettsia endosymbiont of Ceutorhynchus assimilis]
MLKKTLLSFIVFIVTFIAPISEAKKTIKISPKPPIQTSLVVDAKTGKVLHAQNAQIRIYPASLTKLMTLYLMFEAIETGKLSLNKKLVVSKKAENMAPCKLGLKAGETITVKEAIIALIVKSANDVAVAVAENMKGSEKDFAHLMNVRAHQLGMKDTYFKNASGWHDPLQKTTARDLAKLALALQKNYPSFYPLFSKTSFVFRGNTVYGHNKITQNYQGANGLKTGYHTPAGFNLVTTASRNGKSLIAVVTGRKTAISRDKQMIGLLDQHFNVAPSKPSIKLASNNKSKAKKLGKKKVIRS